jgi:hypothetical protein
MALSFLLEVLALASTITTSEFPVEVVFLLAFRTELFL